MTLYGLPGSTLVLIISFGKVGQAHAGLKEHPSTKQTKWPDKVTGEAKRPSAPQGGGEADNKGQNSRIFSHAEKP